MELPPTQTQTSLESNSISVSAAKVPLDRLPRTGESSRMKVKAATTLTVRRSDDVHAQDKDKYEYKDKYMAPFVGSMIENLDGAIAGSVTRLMGVFMRIMMRFLETGAWRRRITMAMAGATRLPRLTALSLSPASQSRSHTRAPHEQNGDGLVHGIRNYGQTCFLNSVLQSLAASEPFVAYLERVVEMYQERIDFESWKTPLPDQGTEETMLSLSEILSRLLREVNGQSKHDNNNIDPRAVLQVVGKEHSQFRARYGSGRSINSVGKEQQDAEELLQALVGIVVEDARLDSASSVSPSLFIPSLLDLEQDNCNCDDDEVLTIMSCLRDRNRNKKESDISLLGQIVVDKKEPLLEVSMLGESESRSVSDLHLREGTTKTNGHNHNGASALLVDHCRIKPVENRSELPSSLTDQREEKKQEEFELHVPQVYSEENLHIDVPMLTVRTSAADSVESISDVSKDSTMTNAMHIMMSTISSISSSPFSGWMGSALQCRACKHVRPIQNTPFFDIPVVPEAVSSYFASVSSTAARGDPPRKHSHASPGPPCRLEDCLKEFTCVERVQDVECRCCTLRAETTEVQEEVDMLQGAVSALLARAKRNGSEVVDENEHVKSLRDELIIAQSRLNLLSSTSPDDEGPVDTIFGPVEDEFMGRETKERRLKRGEALKCLLITRLPSVLCIHVQRRYYDPLANRMSKTLQHVIFPEYLDVAPYCAYSEFGSTNARWGGTFPERPSSRGRAPIRYRLVSVIEHRGNAFQGHYICYRRDPSNGSWLFISDSKVISVNWQDVQQCQAYMLFYEAM
jgi:ubiquitin C-terminal hydrolase